MGGGAMTAQEAIELDRALKDAAYWRDKYQTAVDALKRARSGMSMTAHRRAVLALLGDLKPGAAMSARVVTESLRWRNTTNTQVMLAELEGFGWVDAVVPQSLGERCKLIDVPYRLAHMAVAPEADEVPPGQREEAAGLPLWQG